MGHRFFPDGDAGRFDGKNIVRVRAILDDGIAVGTPVFFRSFDQDDPSDTAIADGLDWSDDLRESVDPDEDKGNDNRSIPIAGNKTDGRTNIFRPVESKEGAGTRHVGRLRAVNVDPVSGDLKVARNFSANGTIVMARAKVAMIGGVARRVAEVDLLTSFAPGDNFRVAASFSGEGLEAFTTDPENNEVGAVLIEPNNDHPPNHGTTRYLETP